jgi:uncharacterized protein DUF6790
MYFIFVVLLMFVLPVASIATEVLWFRDGAGLMFLIGKWFVFWTVGVRLLLAGIRQVVQPRFTAESIFDVKDPAANAMVREIGFGNLAMGTVGLASPAQPAWLVPAAIVGGLYYGLAGAGHLFRSDWNFNEQTALVSDLMIFVVLAVVAASNLW